jgi:hypothetical protein
MNIPSIAEIVYAKIDFIVGLLLGCFGTLYSRYERKKELRTILYYPLWLACYNLLLLFDEINKYAEDETRGKELFNSVVLPLNDIMYSHGTAVHLKGKLKESEEDYLSIFFRVKRICFKNAKERTYSGDDHSFLNKIEEFEGLYKDIKNLKEFCERKDKTLKVGRRI